MYIFIFLFIYKILRLASPRLQILVHVPVLLESPVTGLRLADLAYAWVHNEYSTYSKPGQVPPMYNSTLGISCTISPLGPPPSAAAPGSLFLITLYPPASAAGAFRKSQELKTDSSARNDTRMYSEARNTLHEQFNIEICFEPRYNIGQHAP